MTDDRIYFERERSGRFLTPNQWESLSHMRDFRPGGMGISSRIVKAHLTSVYNKLGVDSLTAAFFGFCFG
jgi:hypothetical protein